MPDEPVIGDMTDDDVVDTAPPDPAALIRLLNRGRTKRERSRMSDEELAEFIIDRLRREWKQD